MKTKTKLKSLLSLLLTLVMLLGLVPLPVQAAYGGGEYQWDPYYVYDYDELWNAMDYRGNATGKKFIRLGADIDTSSENSGFGLPADKSIKMETYQLSLDLNGKTLTILSQAEAFHSAISARGNLTIGDSAGGGKILHRHTLETNHAVVETVGYYTLTLNDGVTLETEAPVHSMNANTAVWLRGGAYGIVNNAKLLFECEQEIMGSISHNINRPSGILVHDDAKLAIYGGEFTRVSVSKTFQAGGDKIPQVLINGGLFRHAMEIYAGDTLDKNGPRTLPIRINGGEFRQADGTHLESNRDREQPFHILIDHAGYGKATFLNFTNEPGSIAWEGEVRDILHEVYRNLFPESTVFLIDDTLLMTNDPPGRGNSLVDWMHLYTFRDYRVRAWIADSEYDDGKLINIYPDSIRVYGNLFDVKAEYGSEDALAGTVDNPVVTDLSRNNELTITWSDVTDERLAYRRYSTVMYYAPSVSASPQRIYGASNGDGTRSATVTLPQIASGQSYSPFFFQTLVMNGQEDNAKASSSKMLYLKSQTTETISYLPFKLDSPLNAGDTKGPTISGIGITPDNVTIEQQSPWTFETYDDNDDLVDVEVSEANPIPISKMCSTTLRLKAKPGYEFKTATGTNRPQAGLQLDGTFLQEAYMFVSDGGKTATVTFDLTSTAEYKELNITVPNVKARSTIPSKQDIVGLPSGAAEYISIEWTYKSNPESSTSYTAYPNNTFLRGYYYQCEIYIVPMSGVTVPSTVKATINEKPAAFSGGYNEGFTLTSQWFYIPDPRIGIEEVTLFADDELTSYTADTELLTAVAAYGQYKKVGGKWYDGANQVTTGRLIPGKTYTYRVTYQSETNYRFETDGFTARIYGGNTIPAEYIDVRIDSLVINYPFTIPQQTYTATVDQAGSYTVVFAGYGSNSRLSYLKTAAQNFTVGENVIEIPTDVNILSVSKIFVWKNLSSMQPMCEALEVNQ